MSMFSSNDNYPAGVTDAHPHFNPVESVMAVACEEDETEVVPTHELKERLNELAEMLDPRRFRLSQHGALLAKVKELQERVEELEDVSNYECPFKGDVEVQITDNGATAEWTCPVCANPHTEDIGGDEDPDRARDEAYDRKFD